MSDAFPTFDSSGNLLGNLTSNQGDVPANISGVTITPLGGSGGSGFSLPSTSSLPSIGGSAATGAPSIQTAAASAGITGGSIPPSATTGAPGTTTGGTAANNWFARAGVVILGFIFVAEGLHQFGIVPSVNPIGR